MDDRCPLGIPARSHACQKSRDTGTDVLSEEHEHRAVDINHPSHCQRLEDTDGGWGRLDYRREHSAYQDSQDGIGELGYHMDECLGIPERDHGIAHHPHSDEQHADTCNDAAHMLDLFVLHENQEHDAHKCNQRRKGPDVQGNQLSGNGGTHVGSHDDPDSLLKCHQAGINKPHRHDRGCRWGLD